MKTYHRNNEKLVTKVFEDVFDKYDLMNDLMSLGIHRIWKKNFINWLNPQKNSSLIDVASGTGDIAKLFLNKINYEGTVCCVDENKEMLNINKKKFKTNAKIKWFCNSAENLPFKNNSFDLVTMSFSLRNVESISKTLFEIKRILKKNGQFICLEFGKVKNLALSSIYKIYSDNFIPKLGKTVTGNQEAYNYLIQSIKRFPSQEKICKILKSKKFNNVKYIDLSFGIVTIYSCKK